MANSDYFANREEIKRSIATLFQVCVTEYGRALVAENMLDASSRESIEQAILYWCDRLQEAKIKPSQVNSAIELVKRDARFTQYPPKLRQFMELCRPRPTDLKLPDFDEAFMIACGTKPVDQMPKALLYAIQKTGRWELTNAQSGAEGKELRQRFNKYYQEAIDLSVAGSLTLNKPTTDFNGLSINQTVSIRNDDTESINRAVSMIDDMIARISNQ